MKTKIIVHRIMIVAISFCMAAAYTSVGAFADVTGASQDGDPVAVEQMTEDNTTAIGVDEKIADPNAAESEAVNNSVATDNTDSTIQGNDEVSGPEEPVDPELDADESDIQSSPVPAEKKEGFTASEEARAFSYDEDESISNEEMPVIYYLIGVVFKGIKKASLISSKYRITFDGITFYQDGNGYSSYLDKVSFTKEEASIDHDKSGNVVLSWLFDGHRVDEYGQDIYTILDLDTARQYGTHIPGYTLRGSKTQNAHLFFNLSWDDEEYDRSDLSMSILIAGISVTENTYEKAGSVVRDYSPDTGDYQMVSLLGIIMFLSLLSASLTVLTGRGRRA